MNRFCSFSFAALTAVLISAAEGVSQTSNGSTVTNSSTMSKILSTNPSATRQKQVLTDRGVPQRIASVSEPSWDWTKDVPQTLYTIDSRGTDSLRVLLPWFAVGTKIYQALGNYPASEIDFYKQEGWALVFKDFGTPQLPDVNPAFALYNKYRGILRFFFWNLSTVTRSDDYALVSLTVIGENSSPLFTFYPGVPQFSDQYAANLPDNSQLYALSTLESNAWCYVDFNLIGFDPEVNSKYVNFEFEIYGSTGWQVDGNNPLNTVIGGNEDQTHTAFNIQISGDEPLAYAFKETRGIQGLRQEIINNADSSTAGWYKSRLNQLAVTAESGSASWLNDVSQLAGIVDGFSGLITASGTGNQISAPMPFDFEGMTSMGGSDITIRTLLIWGFPVPASYADTSSDMPTTYYSQPLGLFNVISEPTVDYCYKVSSYQSNSGTRLSYTYGIPYFALDKPVQIVYNPFDGLTLSSATASLVSTSSGPVTEYTSLNAFPSFSFKSPQPVQISKSASANFGNQVGNISDGPLDPLPGEIAVNLKFTYFDSLTNEVDTVLFIKTYPVNLKYDPSIVNRPLGSSASAAQSGQGGTAVPASFVIGNYPNPFNPTTNVEYQLRTASRVTITVYNLLGQKVAVLEDGVETAGVHDAIFNGSGFASGIYFLRFIAQPQGGSKPIIQTGKMMLLK
ncbi:MAG: T9SS type A sorting domain-containing protein [Bacteroidetes bacterium]|nr:T9SS type A sorting domain-containing protein [Bacteroidota bacterium]